MLKIVNERKRTKFESIKCGEVFEYEGKIFMKITPSVPHGSSTLHTAINLSDGIPSIIQGADIVTTYTYTELTLK